ncbi:hypothetical protein NDU88_004547 [Pleurodeles waltl]|uniref:Uncharacterized protein n=1 Tax=Pleurodeles waltl TaxID=8319 RepID=A0AAV7L0M4_PLEWA|nr:hypothetical protein NDU88_004547 [Pleurodeles waltl]
MARRGLAAKTAAPATSQGIHRRERKGWEAQKFVEESRSELPEEFATLKWADSTSKSSGSSEKEEKHPL